MPILLDDDERFVIEQFDARGNLGIRAWFRGRAEAFEASARLLHAGIVHDVYRLVTTDAEALA